jgi:hypothetical protein
MCEAIIEQASFVFIDIFKEIRMIGTKNLNGFIDKI